MREILEDKRDAGYIGVTGPIPEGSQVRSLGTQPTILSEIRVIVADERKLFRQGLLALFTTERGILVVGDAADGAEAVNLVLTQNIDVLVLDMDLPILDGLAVAERIRRMSDPPELVFLAGRHNETMMREAFLLGARAYLLKSCDFKELVFAIRKVASGDYYLSGPAGHEVMLDYVNPGVSSPEDGGPLTRREKEMCRLLSDGFSTKEAAERLGISPKTAETHRATIMRKLRARNVTDLVKYSLRNGLIKL